MPGEEVTAILCFLFSLSVFQPTNRWETKCQVLQNPQQGTTELVPFSHSDDSKEKTLLIPEYHDQCQTQQTPFQGATQHEQQSSTISWAAPPAKVLDLKLDGGLKRADHHNEPCQPFAFLSPSHSLLLFLLLFSFTLL